MLTSDYLMQQKTERMKVVRDKKHAALIRGPGLMNLKKATAIGGISLMLFVSGCGLQPNEETMDRQQQYPSWFGQSVRDKVYGQSVREHVYSKEVITRP